MGQSLSKIYIHIVFSTKNRQPWLTSSIRADVHAYIAGVANHDDCPALCVGGVADHVHVLCRMRRTATVGGLVSDLKRASTVWIKTRFPNMHDFSWQAGYGAFSISPSEIDAVYHYISMQEEHHRVRTFQEEFRAVLKEHGLEWDERYLWD